MGFIGRAVAPTPISANDVPDLPTSKITSGTFADGRISASSVTQHSAPTDLQPVKSDITALALREATNENSAGFNLPNQLIDTFATDTLGTKTNADVVTGEGMVATMYTTTGAFANDSNTVLLYHFDNNLNDSSSNTINLSSSGGVSYSTSVKKFGTHSVKLDGTNGYLYSPNLASNDDSVTAPSTGVFTYEYWLYQVAYTGADRWFSLGNQGSVSSGNTIGLSNGNGNNSDEWNVYNSTGNPMKNNLANPTGSWTHHAITRDSGNNLRLFQDGVYKASVGSTDNSSMAQASMQGGDGVLWVGARGGSTSEYVNGYFDEIRYSNNVRYDVSSASINDTIFTPNQITGSNATGLIISNTNTVGSAKTKVGGTMLYKDSHGTATLGTDFKIYFTCNGGTNWTEASSYSAITPVYSTGIKQVRLGETTCTSGTDVRYKVEWANQSSGSKETQLHGIGINY
jgi:hypothetical protein